MVITNVVWMKISPNKFEEVQNIAEVLRHVDYETKKI